MAMTIEQLKERASKLEIKIKKLEKKVNRYANLVSDDFKEIVDEVIKTDNYTKLGDYNKIIHNSYYCQGDESEYYSVKSDLEAAIKTYNKYKAKMDEIIRYESEEKIPVIWEFLNNWEKKAYDWYVENAKWYIELKGDYNEVWEHSKEAYQYDASYTKYHEKEIIKRIRYDERKFREKYFEGIYPLTKLIVHYDTIDLDKLAKMLKEEKDAKYKELINRVTKIVGTITDASNLSIGEQHGEINGIIIGEKGKCILETISAGGYNIQCFHYRVLIKEIK